MPSACLTAEFARTYTRGPTIRAAIDLPAEGFHCAVLFGPSGGGKSTILRCLAGLERPDSGSIRFSGEVWFDAAAGINLRPQQRAVGMVFQDYALFPHLTVFENVAYALVGVDRAERQRRVVEVLERFGLAGLDNRTPRQLSGGQQQRVALARTVIARPRLLLLDEPLSALDAATREQTRRELLDILRDLALPVLLVTHDALEAITFGDSALIVIDGQVRQSGPLDWVFSRPADLDVARVVGVESIAVGRVTCSSAGMLDIEAGTESENSTTARISAVGELAVGTAVHVCIRAADVVLHRHEPTDSTARNRWRGRVTRVEAAGGGGGGATLRVDLDCGFSLSAVVTRMAAEELGLVEGATVFASVKATAVHVIERGVR